MGLPRCLLAEVLSSWVWQQVWVKPLSLGLRVVEPRHRVASDCSWEIRCGTEIALGGARKGLMAPPGGPG